MTCHSSVVGSSYAGSKSQEEVVRPALELLSAVKEEISRPYAYTVFHTKERQNLFQVNHGRTSIPFFTQKKEKTFFRLVQTGDALLATFIDLRPLFSTFNWHTAKLNVVSLTGQQRARDVVPRGKRIEVVLSSLAMISLSQ